MSARLCQSKAATMIRAMTAECPTNKRTTIEEGIRDDLHHCFGCDAKARVMVTPVDKMVTIGCSRYGCRIVSAETWDDALKLWDAKDFRDGPC